jgi:hypothetical protein
MQTYLGLFLEDRRRRALAEVYLEMLDGASERSLSFEQVSAAELEAWGRAWSALSSPPAWLPVRGWPTRSADGTRIIQRDGRVFVEHPGCEPRDLLAAPTSSSRDVWDRSGDVDPDALPAPPTLAEALEDGWAEHIRGAVERWGREYLVHGHLGTPFGGAYARMGFAGMMAAMRSDPDSVEAVIDNRLAHLFTRLEIYAEAGVECVFVEETLSSSDLISEDDYLRFSFPGNRELFQHARDLGIRTVYYYCGALEKRLEHLKRLPADALAFEESKKGFEVNLAAVREAIGPDRPLLGNIDAVLIRDAGEVVLRRAVQRQFEAAGPLLATSAGSPLTPDTEIPTLDLLVALTERQGR